MKSLSGSCLCNAVQYTCKSDIKNCVNCHCSICRKLTGGAFASYFVVMMDDYTIVAGQEQITSYTKPNTTMQKHFCRQCGTPLFNTNPKYGEVRIVYLGTLAEKDNKIIPRMNIYCDDKLNWLNELFTIENFSTGKEN